MIIYSKKVKESEIFKKDNFSNKRKKELLGVLDSMYVSKDYKDYNIFNLNYNCKKV